MYSKVCFITGANSGIGKAAAIQFAQIGFHVLVGSRNREKGLIAVTEIQQKSNSTSVELIEIDLSFKASIFNAATLILQKYAQLDVLIHNAADFDLSRKSPVFTIDGIESIWATNHIGPVYLTNQLLPLLKNSLQARILTVASKGLVLYPYLKIHFTDIEFKSRRFSVSKAYYQSKLAQLMYTYWLAKSLQDTSITVNCIRVPNVQIDLNRYPNISWVQKLLYSIKSKFSLSPEEMAKTYVFLATSEDLASISGQYFNELNLKVDSSSYSKIDKNLNALMRLTNSYLK